MIQTTYTFWQAFKNCRKKAQVRYLMGYVPLERSDNMFFGGVIHTALEMWYKVLGKEFFHDFIAKSELAIDLKIKAGCMMDAYTALYPEEDFEIYEIEEEFEDDIINPETGAKSRSFTIGGKVDMIVRKKYDGTFWLVEHKTASGISEGYIAKLWTDFQIVLYSYYIERKFGIKITGIIYNILGKCGIKMRVGESEEEYQERYAALVAKSKHGKSSAKRKFPDTPEEFADRVREYYQDPMLFHREEIILDRAMIKEMQYEVWDLTKSLLEAKSRNMYYRNTGFCYYWNKPCEYFPYCSSRENPLVLENLYRKEDDVHPELSGEKDKAF